MPVGTEIDLGPGHIVLDWEPAPPWKGAQQPPPSTQPMSIVAKRSPISANAERLFIILCAFNSYFFGVVHAQMQFSYP